MIKTSIVTTSTLGADYFVKHTHEKLYKNFRQRFGIMAAAAFKAYMDQYDEIISSHTLANGNTVIRLELRPKKL